MKVAVAEFRREEISLSRKRPERVILVFAPTAKLIPVNVVAHGEVNSSVGHVSVSVIPLSGTVPLFVSVIVYQTNLPDKSTPHGAKVIQGLVC